MTRWDGLVNDDADRSQGLLGSMYGGHGEGEMMRDVPEKGDVAYFVHLHVDTAECMQKHDRLPDTHVYRIDGKPRPMLVLSVLDETDRKRRWLLTLPITTKSMDSKDHVRDDMLWIGNCLNKEKPSFVKLELHRLPDNLLHAQGGKSPVVTPCDPVEFRNVFRIISHKAMRGRLPRIV